MENKNSPCDKNKFFASDSYRFANRSQSSRRRHANRRSPLERLPSRDGKYGSYWASDGNYAAYLPTDREPLDQTHPQSSHERSQSRDGEYASYRAFNEDFEAYSPTDREPLDQTHRQSPHEKSPLRDGGYPVYTAYHPSGYSLIGQEPLDQINYQTSFVRTDTYQAHSTNSSRKSTDQLSRKSDAYHVAPYENHVNNRSPFSVDSCELPRERSLTNCPPPEGSVVHSDERRFFGDSLQNRQAFVGWSETGPTRCWRGGRRKWRSYYRCRQRFGKPRRGLEDWHSHESRQYQPISHENFPSQSSHQFYEATWPTTDESCQTPKNHYETAYSPYESSETFQTQPTSHRNFPSHSSQQFYEAAWSRSNDSYQTLHNYYETAYYENSEIYQSQPISYENGQTMQNYYETAHSLQETSEIVHSQPRSHEICQPQQSSREATHFQHWSSENFQSRNSRVQSESPIDAQSRCRSPLSNCQESNSTTNERARSEQRCPVVPCNGQSTSQQMDSTLTAPTITPHTPHTPTSNARENKIEFPRPVRPRRLEVVKLKLESDLIEYNASPSTPLSSKVKAITSTSSIRKLIRPVNLFAQQKIDLPSTSSQEEQTCTSPEPKTADSNGRSGKVLSKKPSPSLEFQRNFLRNYKIPKLKRNAMSVDRKKVVQRNVTLVDSSRVVEINVASVVSCTVRDDGRSNDINKAQKKTKKKPKKKAKKEVAPLHLTDVQSNDVEKADKKPKKKVKKKGKKKATRYLCGVPSIDVNKAKTKSAPSQLRSSAVQESQPPSASTSRSSLQTDLDSNGKAIAMEDSNTLEDEVKRSNKCQPNSPAAPSVPAVPNQNNSHANSLSCGTNISKTSNRKTNMATLTEDKDNDNNAMDEETLITPSLIAAFKIFLKVLNVNFKKNRNPNNSGHADKMAISKNSKTASQTAKLTLRRNLSAYYEKTPWFISRLIYRLYLMIHISDDKEIVAGYDNDNENNEGVSEVPAVSAETVSSELSRHHNQNLIIPISSCRQRRSVNANDSEESTDRSQIRIEPVHDEGKRSSEVIHQSQSQQRFLILSANTSVIEDRKKSTNPSQYPTEPLFVEDDRSSQIIHQSPHHSRDRCSSMPTSSERQPIFNRRTGTIVIQNSEESTNPSQCRTEPHCDEDNRPHSGNLYLSMCTPSNKELVYYNKSYVIEDREESTKLTQYPTEPVYAEDSRSGEVIHQSRSHSEGQQSFTDHSANTNVTQGREDSTNPSRQPIKLVLDEDIRSTEVIHQNQSFSDHSANTKVTQDREESTNPSPQPIQLVLDEDSRSSGVIHQSQSFSDHSANTNVTQDREESTNPSPQPIELVLDEDSRSSDVIFQSFHESHISISSDEENTRKEVAPPNNHTSEEESEHSSSSSHAPDRCIHIEADINSLEHDQAIVQPPPPTVSMPSLMCRIYLQPHWLISGILSRITPPISPSTVPVPMLRYQQSLSAGPRERNFIPIEEPNLPPSRPPTPFLAGLLRYCSPLASPERFQNLLGRWCDMNSENQATPEGQNQPRPDHQEFENIAIPEDQNQPRPNSQEFDVTSSDPVEEVARPPTPRIARMLGIGQSSHDPDNPCDLSQYSNDSWTEDLYREWKEIMPILKPDQHCGSMPFPNEGDLEVPVMTTGTLSPLEESGATTSDGVVQSGNREEQNTSSGSQSEDSDSSSESDASSGEEKNAEKQDTNNESQSEDSSSDTEASSQSENTEEKDTSNGSQSEDTSNGSQPEDTSSGSQSEDDSNILNEE